MWCVCLRVAVRKEKPCCVIGGGNYGVGVGGCSVGNCAPGETRVVEQCGAICSSRGDMKKRILDRMPEALTKNTKQKISFEEVREGKADLSDFIAQLNPEELEALSRGHGMMNSPLGAPGNAGVFGGVIPSLQEKGVPAITCCDGPAGIRMQKYCSLVPCGTGLAATWNRELTEKLYSLVGSEMKYYGVDILLAPGMNIHRNPLCGRNF